MNLSLVKRFSLTERISVDLRSERLDREGFQQLHHYFCVQFRPGARGVRVPISKERFHGWLAEGVAAFGDAVIEIQQRNPLFGGNGTCPGCVTVHRPGDLAMLPELAGHQGTDDGRGAASAGLFDVAPEVPAPRVDGLAVTAGQIPEFAFGTDTLDGRVRAVVVVAELHEDQVSGLDDAENRIPISLRPETADSGASDGSVDEVHFGVVEVSGEGRTPTPLAGAVGSVATTIADGGIADQEEGGESGVVGLRQIEPAEKGGRVLSLRVRCGSATVMYGAASMARPAGDNVWSKAFS